MPNWDGIGAVLCGRKWSHLIPPEHFDYFGPKSLSNLVGSSGLVVLMTSTVSPTVITSIQNWPVVARGLQGFYITWHPL